MADTPQKSWQARISEATDALAQSFVESISYDRRLYKHDIAGSIAHATMLAKVGLITDAERDAIVEGLKGIERDIEAGNFVFDQSLEDIHMVIEDALIKRIGEPGKKLHTGRSRNDQVATDLLLWCKSSALSLISNLYAVTKSFVAAAERNSSVVMPCFTHLQRAQPIYAGAELLAWAKMFSQDSDRIEKLLGEDSFLYATFPLGSGAIAGSTLPLDRRITQNLLEGLGVPTEQELSESYADWSRRVGRREPTPGEYEYDPFQVRDSSSLEGTASRDAACDLVYCCAMVAQHLSRWAEQWIIYMSTEFSFIKIADRYTTSSSMMPQKRNPDMLELIRGRCGNVYGDLFALMTILKGLPIGYNRDLQEDKRIVFRAYDTVSSCLTMAAAIVNSASYDK
ncbi:MAG TPA: argininosuccinate lyase, partial [Tepidisphaeraceae bacterium]|nr:argininosuccinate lyase [Tepidisphaeraceae bacterium]